MLHLQNTWLSVGIAYEKDIVAWANEQASFIRAGRFELLDLEHILSLIHI